MEDETLNLTPEEARVLGCLMEKEATTPDIYPLTLNSLILACNQKTNRHPVVEYEEELREIADELDVPIWEKMPRAPGQKEERYRQVLTPLLEEPTAEGSTAKLEAPMAAVQARNERIAVLEMEVAVVKEELEALKAEFSSFKQQFE